MRLLRKIRTIKNFEILQTLVLTRISRIMEHSICITNKYGVKKYNASNDKHPGVLYQEGIVIDLNPNVLRLGPDMLKDQFTHLNKKIVDSPHYKLTKGCMEGDLGANEYILLEQKGMLDGRPAFFKDVSFHFNKNRDCNKSILDGEYFPIKVYLIDDVYYVFDGKHRAAMACYLNVNIRAMVIPKEIILTEGLLSIKDKKQFTRHTEFIKRLQNG